MKGVDSHTFSRVLRYCAGANLLLTKTGLPALFEPKFMHGLELWCCEFSFRGILVRAEPEIETATALLTIAPTNPENVFFDPTTLTVIAEALQHQTYVGWIDEDGPNSSILYPNAPANVAAAYAAATMISSTRFDTTPYEVSDD